MAADEGPWVYFPDLPEVGGRVELDGREARHAASSRRLGIGDSVVVFDGRGTHARGRLVAIGKRSVQVEIGERRVSQPDGPDVHLGTAVPKGDRWTTLLSMVTQLGVGSITALDCERAVVRTDEGVAERWTRIVVEAAKQSRRPVLPRLEAGERPGRFARVWTASGALVLLLHPESAMPTSSVDLGLVDVLRRAPRDLPRVMLVGPEGGWTESEVAECEESGARRVGLGRGVLRVETAGVTAVALARQVSRDGE